MIAHTWTHNNHNRCEFQSSRSEEGNRNVAGVCEAVNICGARVAWRLKLATASTPEFYCAVCAPLVAAQLGITDPSRAATLREGQPSEVLQVHASASEGDLSGQNRFDQETSEAADARNISGLIPVNANKERR